MKTLYKIVGLLLVLTIFVTACGNASADKKASNVIEYTLKTEMANGQMIFTGVGGGIDGFTNPTLTAQVGDTVKVTLTSGDGVEHGITFPDFNAVSQHVVGKGSSTTVTFTVDKPGNFKYFCEIAGHKEAGMIGEFDVMGTAAANTSSQPTTAPVMGMVAAPTSGSPTTGEDIARDPTDLPAEIGDRAPMNVRIDLEAKEVIGQLADGTTFPYWTFNGKVPGPFFRVRVGDTVEVHLKNDPNSTMAHSVDFHAVTGPGGGAVFTSVTPGQESMFTFKALVPGLYVYHCATPMVAEHIANGMYGMILVEPEGGLTKVDREFYVMQGEIYTSGKFGDQGLMQPDTDKLLNETPDYYVLNGEVGALTAKHPLKANVGETARIFFGVGGPNKTSSFHVIGEIFDKVYNLASVTSDPLTNVQTTTVPPGGATIVEFGLQVPGRYILVDHALARLQRGLAGYLVVDGAAQPEIFDGTPMPGSGH